jgi:hypothetical protein
MNATEPTPADPSRAGAPARVERPLHAGYPDHGNEPTVSTSYALQVLRVLTHDLRVRVEIVRESHRTAAAADFYSLMPSPSATSATSVAMPEVLDLLEVVVERIADLTTIVQQLDQLVDRRATSRTPRTPRT